MALGGARVIFNPSLPVWPASKVGNWAQSGMAAMGIRSNTWAGGDDKMSDSNFDYLLGSTVALDGKKVIENGHL